MKELENDRRTRLTKALIRQAFTSLLEEKPIHNADLCTVTLGEHGDKDFALRLVSIGRESYLRAYSRQFPAATRRQLEYFYAFASGGHMGLLRQWVEEGMAASPEEMALAAENIMRYGMEFLQAAQS